MTSRVDYLAGLRCVVVGSGAVALTAQHTLTALGAEVIATTILDVSTHHDVVICDRVADGTDDGYVEHVGRWATARLAGGPATWVTVSAFGMDGPFGGLPGSDLVCAAAGGMLFALSDADGHVHQMPGEQALQATGLLAVLAALHGTSLGRSDGSVVHLDLSAQEATAFSSVQQELAHLLYRCGGRGGAARYSAPAGVFECADGLINIIVIDDHQFARVAEVVGRPDWVQRFPTLPDRVTHGDEINAAVQDWLATRPKVECERALQGNGVPATAVRTVAEVNASEQFVARQWTERSGSDDVPPLPAIIGRGAALDGASAGNGATNDLGELRVVEVTNVLAGPLSGAILGAMGAEVVRLEDGGRLDVYRRNGPFADGEPGPERAAYFLCSNHCKRSVYDGVGADSDIARRALDWAHVMIENVGSSRLTRLGIGDPAVGGGAGGMAASISGYGRSGPHEGFRGYAPNVHAYAGLTAAIHDAVGSRIYLIGALADYAAAIWVATLSAAWFLGGAKGIQRVDLSMAEAVAVRLRHLDGGIGPVTEGRLIDVAGGQTVAVSTRPEHHELVETVIAKEADNGGDALVAALHRVGVAAYSVRSTADVVTDPQLRAREFFLAIDHPVVRDAEIITLPWKPAGSSRTGRYRGAPLLGHDDPWATTAFASTSRRAEASR